ncbi:MAG: alpha-L-fucosidase [Bacteroidales bacterium]|nr:alpha-L-fucosidase [Bacteroidales bacterium]
MRNLLVLLACAVLTGVPAAAQQNDNKPESVESFMDLGFGMFIHWSMDSQLGTVISHSLAGASAEYQDRFFNELPKTFNPKKFNPEDWAVLAKLAGMKYVVFTTKHHLGFCMWPTKTTDFCLSATPFKRDITGELVQAFRAQGLKVGFYFSPEDFSVLHSQGLPIGRVQHPLHYPVNNPKLMDIDKRQLRELLTRYGKIDILFFDGPSAGLKELAWSLQPDVMVTRGHISTPEQETPNAPMPGPWESCYTMGTDWQYKPTNDPHKSGGEIIRMLIEIRAKGGNFLLNVGPKPDGEIQIEQEARLREVALWNFVNGEAIHGVRPWKVTHEGSIWYTASKDGKTVYAFITDPWPFAQRRQFLFPTIKGGPDTRVSVLGHGGELVEYREGMDAAVRWESTSMGLMVSALRGQRLYTNYKWPNPVVLKLENVSYAPASVATERRDRMDGAK